MCEQLCLQTPSGNNRLRTALNTLAELQDLGLLTLPPPRKQGGRGPQKPLKPSSRTAPQPGGAAGRRRLAAAAPLPAGPAGNLCRQRALRGNLLPGGGLAVSRQGAGPQGAGPQPGRDAQGGVRAAAAPPLAAGPAASAAGPRPQEVGCARAKIHPQAFLRVHRAVLQHAPRDDPRALWQGHRVFAVDGSKLNLPRPLLHDGYRLPSETAHNPQGLLSCLLYWRLSRRAHPTQRLDRTLPQPQGAHALAHLEALAPGEVAVYDRGYYSFRLLHTHCVRGVQAVFRLKKNANGPLRAFIRSALSADEIVVEPSATARAQLPDTLLHR